MTTKAGKCLSKMDQRIGGIGGALASIPREFDVRRLVRAGAIIKKRKRGGFETRKAKREEAHLRIKRLAKSTDTEDSILLRALQSCERDRRCGSWGCPVCARLHRILWSADVLRFLDAYDAEKLRFVTMINPKDALGAGSLRNLDPQKLIHRTRRQLDRLGVDKESSFAIGAVDGEWDAGWGVYQPHMHLIVHDIDGSDLHRMCSKWPRGDKRLRVRLRVQTIDDLPRVVAYLRKSYWPSVARRNNKLGIHPRGKRRPPAHIESEILDWLHHCGYESLMNYGLKAYNGQLRRA